MGEQNNSGVSRSGHFKQLLSKEVREHLEGFMANWSNTGPCGIEQGSLRCVGVPVSTLGQWARMQQ